MRPVPERPPSLLFDLSSTPIFDDKYRFVEIP
jgi:hypothetical protein